ncbi:MAG TPA: hypothetical protein VMH79_13035 [Thermoanaerobaculia bacterium]|nr:hypothetical protein [Thermoanaerobaculia bacterium]
MAEPERPTALEPKDLVELVRSPEAPRELRTFAARGLLPLEPDDRMRALLAVAEDPDAEIGLVAQETFRQVPPDEVARFLDDAEPTETELDVVSRHSDDHAVLERVVRNREASEQTLLRLASIVTGAPQEALIVNQVRLLRRPALIDALLENPGLTADGRRRLMELREEFFEKEERRREQERLRLEEEERRARQEAAGIVFEEGEESATADREAGAEPAEGEAADDDYSTANLAQVFKRISHMTVKEKLGLAQRGSKEERRILIADANKIVSMAVIHNESLTPAEVESFCAMRHIAVEIFHEIASTREWIKRPKIQLALIGNPSVPLSITLPLVKFLGMRDLRNISRDRNLPEGVRVTARKILLEKRG